MSDMRSAEGANPAASSDDDRLPWPFTLAAFLVLTFVLVSQMYVWVNLWPLTIDWGEAVVWSVPQLLVWGLLIHGVAWFSRVFPIEGRSAALRIPVHLAASVAVSALALFTLDVSDRVLHWSTLMGAPGWLVSRFKLTLIHLHIGIGIYWVVIAVDHARRYQRESRERELRASRLEAQLAQAELSALRMQLDPHFLFNTLNSIGVLMRRDVEAAEEMLHRLSDLLQSTLRHGGAPEVTLEEELRYLRSYLEIEEVRFQDRLTVDVEVEPGVSGCAVPFLITQPLVENAIRHGIAPKAEAGRIRVRARRISGGRVEIVVQDDGRGLDPDGRSEGVGLANTRARLSSLYGEDHDFELQDLAEGGVRARLKIPERYPEADAAVAGNVPTDSDALAGPRGSRA